MSLMQLLTMSHCLNGTSEAPHRYKVLRSGLLPKFAPVGRPISLRPAEDFRIKNRPAINRKLEKTIFGAREEFKPKEKKDMTTPPLFEDQPPAAAANTADTGPREQENTPMRILSVGVFPPKLNRLPPPKESWFERLKNMFRRKAAEKSTAKPVSKPVQGEWPMDRIVVVRNDLSDSDYELVWAEGNAESGAKSPSAKPAAKPAPSKKDAAPVSKPEPVEAAK